MEPQINTDRHRYKNVFTWVIILLSVLCVFVVLSVSNVVGKVAEDEHPPAQKPARAVPLAIGQWVKYQVKRYQKDDPADSPSALAEAEIKVAIVSRETMRNDEEYFWVEFVINDGKEQERVIKFMIDLDGNPVAEKLILKYGRLQPVEIHLRIWETKTRITREMLFEDISQEKIPIRFPDKEETTLDCTKVLVKAPYLKVAGYMWYSDKVPLAGLVKFAFIEDKDRTMILLTDYGLTGGQTVIKEQVKKLDFK
ncbi:MAG: hypothetical protein HY762_02645 [Planctomycetes bacterium]|nr:hypothetical protein [Planctomycetota bacterium]